MAPALWYFEASSEASCLLPFAHSIPGILPGIRTREQSMRSIMTLCVAVIALAAPTATAQVLNPANGHVYIATSPSLNILVARAEAAALGGYLVSINDAAENTFVATNFPGTHWIGLSDQVTEGVYQWDSGEPVTYTNWCPNEPMGPVNHDFVEINGQCPGGWNDINATGVLVPGIVEIPFTTPLYQSNSAEASMDVDGITTNGYSVASATKCTGAATNVNFNSILTGVGWDMGYQFNALVPAVVGGGFVTPGAGQVVNLVISQPIQFLNGVNAPNLASTSFNPFTLPISLTTPLTASGQALIANPGSADGFTLTQGCQLDVLMGTPTTQILPLNDDSALNVSVGPPLCGFGGISFYGAVYTDFWVCSNGFVSFGQMSTDFSATVAEFVSEMPRVAGMWTDLEPNAAGTIQVVPNTNNITVQYMGVQSWGAMGVLNSFDIVFDDTGGLTIDNYMPAMAHAQASLTGISNGAAGTPGAAVSFSSVVGAGPQITGVSTNAVYEFNPAGAVAAGWTSLNFAMSDSSVYSVN